MALRMWGQYIIQTPLPAEDPVIVGTAWYDLGNSLFKICTSVSPYTFAAASFVTTHNLLSLTHPDTTPNPPLRGALVTGQGASPTWSRLVLGAATKYLRSDGTDAAWASILDTDLPTTVVLTTGSYADPAWVTSLAGSKITGSVANATLAASATTTAITDDTTTNASVFLTWVTTASGNQAQKTTSAHLFWNPSTRTLQVGSGLTSQPSVALNAASKALTGLYLAYAGPPSTADDTSVTFGAITRAGLSATFSVLGVWTFPSKVGINLGGGAPTTTLHVLSTTTQLRLAYDGSNYTDFLTASDGSLSISPSGTGTITFNANLSFTGTLGTFTGTGAITAPRFIPNGSTVPINGMYLSATNEVAFATNSVSRVKIRATGLFQVISVTSGNNSSDIRNTDANGFGAYFEGGGADATHYLLYVANQAQVLKFKVDGAGVTFTNDGTVSSLSDARTKRRVGDFTRGLTEIRGLVVDLARYRHIQDRKLRARHGYPVSDDEVVTTLAQTAQRWVPEAVRRDAKGFLTLNTGPFLYATMRGVVQLDDRLTPLERWAEARGYRRAA